MAPRVYDTGMPRRKKNSKRSGLKSKAEGLLALLANDPYQTPPSYEKLVGNLAGAYSRRINVQHRLVYQVLDEGACR